jgi:hypothetical protein
MRYLPHAGCAYLFDIGRKIWEPWQVFKAAKPGGPFSQIYPFIYSVSFWWNLKKASNVA